MTPYVHGFLAKCAEYGIHGTDARRMLKRALADYTVKPGDTMWRISRGNGFTVKQLADYNGISDPGSISEGQVIRFPQKAPAAKPAGPKIDRAGLDEIFGTLSGPQISLAKGLYDEARGAAGDMPHIASAIYNRANGTEHIQDVLDTGILNGKRDTDGEYLSYAHRYDNPAEMKAWKAAMEQAKAVYAEGYTPTTTATHFYNGNSVPYWAVGKTALAIPGAVHKFFDGIKYSRPWIQTQK